MLVQVARVAYVQVLIVRSQRRARAWLLIVEAHQVKAHTSQRWQQIQEIERMARATAAHEPWGKLEHDRADAERAKQALRAKKDAKLPPLHILRTQYGLSTRASVQGWHIQFELPCSTNFSKSTTSTHAGSTSSSRNLATGTVGALPRRAGTLPVSSSGILQLPPHEEMFGKTTVPGVASRAALTM